MNKLEYKVKRIDNIDDLLVLTTSVAWSFTGQQFELMISVGAFYGHYDNNRLISCAGIFQYENNLASIGIVCVHPRYRRKGLAKQLMTICMEEANKLDSPISLVSSPEGFPLYKSLGFKAIRNIHRLQLDNSYLALKQGELEKIEQMNIEDLIDVIQLDIEAFGLNRSAMYEQLFYNMESGFVVRGEDRMLKGFSMTMKVGDAIRVSPLIAKDPSIAKLLISNIFGHHACSIQIDVPSNQADFINELEQRYDFKNILLSPQMTLYAKDLPGKNDHMYGILNPAFG
ncbi:GNAT family N-acetyltransferase [Cytobacillus sp. IB215316]|uniref:GNAT family N-acetyltransferase n=1 Tax=Cytobacillus sp. IB215316 TaxID=3097354 RepID=UPI002A0BF26B|nr:GNAT family N-acetyltransferase [Cytobacillus sp. IB215316]MDX8361540.1 GNAT family N-acetyltransferase [Cytobacillus sp. IB215316]